MTSKTFARLILKRIYFDVHHACIEFFSMTGATSSFGRETGSLARPQAVYLYFSGKSILWLAACIWAYAYPWSCKESSTGRLNRAMLCLLSRNQSSIV